MSEFSNKPMTKLKNLLGFSSAKDLGKFLNLSQDAVNSLNIGRGNGKLRKAYQSLCLALERMSAKERRAIFLPPPQEKLTLSQKYLRRDELGKKAKKLAKEARIDFEQAFDTFNEYMETQKEYEEINNEVV